MKTISALIIAVSIFFVNANAQPQKCGTEIWRQSFEQAHPSVAAQTKAMVDEAYNKDRFQGQRRTGTIVLPVVVHVVYNTQVQNISDEQVLSQIKALNEDFTRTNKDTFRTSEVFKSVAASADIKFHLAVRDPWGNSTTGITRTETNIAAFTPQFDEVKFDSSGGRTGWPSDTYLNIWVCNLNAGSLVGYASPIGNNDLRDGVVLKYTAFGTIGEVEHPYNLGRTTTHEVGHWLGLGHPFDGGCVGMDAIACFTEGDRICDTPPEASSNFSCDPGDNTCAESPEDLPDQIENFMDYTDDHCMNMFTMGQVDVMQAMFSGMRAPIASSIGCHPVQTDDAGIEWAALEESEVCVDLIAPEIVLTNFGTSALNNVDIKYSIDDGVIRTFTWTQTLSPLESVNIILGEVAVDPQSSALKVWAESPNGNSDLFADNDTIKRALHIVSPSAEILPFEEDFEGIIFPPLNWEINNPDIATGWALENNVTQTDNRQGKSAFIFFHIYHVMGERDEIIMPMIDLSGATDAMLSFDIALARKSDTSMLRYGKLEVLVALDCETFELIETFEATELVTTPDFEDNQWRPSGDNEWRRHQVDLSSYNGEEVRIMFRMQNGISNNLYLDNVAVKNQEVIITGNPVLEQLDINIYPNPSSGVFMISSNSLSEVAKMVVYNNVGERVKEGVINPNHYKLDLCDLAAGYYLVKITGSNSTAIRPIIKE